MILVFITVAAKTVVAQDYSADVKSTDTIVAALYNVILGEPNTPRDWARFRNLFKPEARLIPTRKNEAGEFTLKAMSPDEYVQLSVPGSQPVFLNGNFTAIARLTEQSFMYSAPTKRRKRKMGPLRTGESTAFNYLRTKTAITLSIFFGVAKAWAFRCPTII